MANDSIDFFRRCSELNLDPDIRVGRLTYVCRLKNKKRICGALFLCDCGKFCKVDITTVLKWSGARADLPWECPKCTLQTKKHRRGIRKHVEKEKKAKARKSLARQRALDRKIANRIPIRGRYKKDFPSEFSSWINMKANNNQIVARWQGEKGFERFLRDMGPKPKQGMFLSRHDTSKPQGPGNSFWSEKRAKRKAEKKKRPRIKLVFKQKSPQVP